MIHDLGVGHSQSHVHGISLAGEFERAWGLAVVVLIQGGCSNFGLLHINRTNRDPSCAFSEVAVF